MPVFSEVRQAQRANGALETIHSLFAEVLERLSQCVHENSLDYDFIGPSFLCSPTAVDCYCYIWSTAAVLGGVGTV